MTFSPFSVTARVVTPHQSPSLSTRAHPETQRMQIRKVTINKATGAFV